MESVPLLTERTIELIKLIESLNIEQDLERTRDKLDSWKMSMTDCISEIHRRTKNKIQSMIIRLKTLKDEKLKELKIDYEQKLQKSISRKQPLYPQETKDIQDKLTRMNNEVKRFGKLLTDLEQDQLELQKPYKQLRSIQKENSNLAPLLNSTVGKEFELNNLKMSTTAAYLATSDKHILIEDNEHVLLFDKDVKLKEFEWRHDIHGGKIKDLCWSHHLQVFFILSAQEFHTYDPFTFTLEKIEQIKPFTGTHFQSVTCYRNSDIYLCSETSSNKTYVEKWSMLSCSMIRRWWSDIFEFDDQYISCLRQNDSQLVACIQDKQQQWRCDLFDFELKRLERGQLLKNTIGRTFVSSLFDHQWLIITTNGGAVWLMSEQGQLIEHKDMKKERQLIQNASMMGDTLLVLKMIEPNEIKILEL